MNQMLRFLRTGKSLLILLAYIFTITLCVGCQQSTLHVKRINLKKNNLASQYANSPDFRSEVDYRGEKLIISWKNPARGKSTLAPAYLKLKVRYKNYTDEEILIPTEKYKGRFIFSLLGEKFQEKKGILSYYCASYDLQDRQIEEHKHYIWEEWID